MLRWLVASLLSCSALCCVVGSALIGSALLVTALLVTPGTASAQSAHLIGDVGMDAHLFRPAVDSKGYISTNGTNILGDGDYSFGLVLDAGFGIMPFEGFVYARSTTVDFSGAEPSGYESTDHLIDAAITGTLHFNYGIANTAAVGIQVPIMVLGGPNVIVPGVYNNDGAPLGLDTQGFGNITLHGKLRMLRYEQHAIDPCRLTQPDMDTPLILRAEAASARYFLRLLLSVPE